MNQEIRSVIGAASRGRRLSILVCGAVLAFSPLAYAAVHPWAYFSVALVTAGLSLVLLAVALFRLLSRGAQEWSLPYPPLWWLAAALALLTILQAASWPQEVVRWVSPGAWEVRSLGGGFGLADYLPFTLNPDATVMEFMKLWPGVVLFFLLIYTVNLRRQIRGLVWLILTVASFEVVYGFWNYRSHLIWGWANPYTGSRLCGTFINSNHLALYLVMAILLGYGFFLGKMASLPRPPESATTWGLIRRLSQAEHLEPQIRRLLLLFLLLVLTVALIFTGSRGGMLALAGGFALMVLVDRGQRREKGYVLLIVVLLAGAIVYSLALGSGRLLGRFQDPTSFSSRYTTMQGALAIFRDYPWMGSGFGTFGTVFYRHEPVKLDGLYMIYAHNDWMQLLAEAGLPGIMLGLAGLLAFSSVLLRQWRRQRDPFAQKLGLGGLAALGAAAIHALGDFPLHIPALAFTIAGIAAITYLVLYSRPGLQPFTYPAIKFPQHRRAARFIVAGLMAAQLAFAYQVGYYWLAERAAPTAIDSTRSPGEIRGEDFRRALKLNPRNSQYYLGLAQALEKDQPGAADEAERAFKAAVLQAPADWHCHLKLAEFYLHQRNRDPSRNLPLALEELAAAIKLYPESPELHLYLATTLAWAEKNYPGLIPPGLRKQSAFHYQEARRLKPWLVEELERLRPTPPR